MRISTTQLDQFHKYLTTDYVFEDNIIDSIKGVFIPNKKMLMGTAFDKILENPEKYPDFLCNGFQFPKDIEMVIEEINYEYPFQVKQTKEIAGHTIAAKVDQAEILIVNEHKSTWSSFDIDKYMKSMQWRFYLNIFDSQKVIYKVTEFADKKNGIEFKGYNQFACYPYQSMEKELIELVEHFADFVNKRDLQGYLQPKEYNKVA